MIERNEEDNFDGKGNSDRKLILELFKHQANITAELDYQQNKREKEIFERIDGTKTSVYEEKEKLNKFVEDLPQDYSPKFGLFFSALGKLAGWTDEEMSYYRKPHLGPKTINEIIYSRFPKKTMEHIYNKNPQR